MAQHFRYPLPPVVDTVPRKCFQVEVPDDLRHIAAFKAAIYTLAWQQNWQRDEGHMAKEMAATWLDIWTKIAECAPSSGSFDDMQFRQRGCVLEYSVDCETWLTLYDPTDCIKELIAQQPPGGTVITGDCKEYTVTLAGNNTWKLPIPINDGFTIQISAVKGGWYDGGSGVWACPDGSNYIFGTCAGSQGHVTGDPDGTAMHMELIAVVGGATYPAYNTTITIPGGTGPQDVYLQANDVDLTNNAGSITFHVKVCGAAVTPCSDLVSRWYDGTSSTLGGWSVANATTFPPATILGDSAASYVFALSGSEIPGTGYTTSRHPVAGTIEFGGDCRLTHIKNWNRVASGGFSDVRVYFRRSGVWTIGAVDWYYGVTIDTMHAYELVCDVVCDAVTVIQYSDRGFALGGVELTFT